MRSAETIEKFSFHQKSFHYEKLCMILFIFSHSFRFESHISFLFRIEKNYIDKFIEILMYLAFC